MLILASKSQARRALLTGTGLEFAAVPASIDERAFNIAAPQSGADPLAGRLARAKATDVSVNNPGAIVIGADQTLTIDGERLHKPGDLDAVRDQLEMLKGRTHVLTTAVCLVRNSHLLWEHTETAEMTVREFSTDEREAVIALEGEALCDCVGAYRLEGASLRLFRAVKGDYFTVLGLPLLPLMAGLRRHAPNVFEISA